MPREMASDSDQELLDDDGSESEMELDLAVDEHGRVAGTSNCGLDFEFAAFAGRLYTEDLNDPTDSLIADCTACFGAEDSFWLPASCAPRCGLERLAKEVNYSHVLPE